MLCHSSDHGTSIKTANIYAPPLLKWKKQTSLHYCSSENLTWLIASRHSARLGQGYIANSQLRALSDVLATVFSLAATSARAVPWPSSKDRTDNPKGFINSRSAILVLLHIDTVIPTNTIQQRLLMACSKLLLRLFPTPRS